MTTLWDKFKSAVRFAVTGQAAVATMEVTPDPTWTAQTAVDAPNGPPTGLTDGVALSGAVVALLGVDMRTGQPTRHYVTIDTWDAAADYTVTVDGAAYTETADTDEATTLAALSLAVDAAPAATAEVIDGRLVVTTEETVSVSATGTGTMAQTGDATSADFRLWLLADGRWYVASDGTWSGVEASWTERAEVAGFERAYIEIMTTDGRVTPRIGPCLEVA